MFVHRRWLAGRGAVLILGIGFMTVLAGLGHGQGQGPTLPDEYYPKMVKYALKGLQDSLKGGTPKDDIQAVKARTAALMIAVYAQQNLTGADAQDRKSVV